MMNKDYDILSGSGKERIMRALKELKESVDEPTLYDLRTRANMSFDEAIYVIAALKGEGKLVEVD